MLCNCDMQGSVSNHFSKSFFCPLTWAVQVDFFLLKSLWSLSSYCPSTMVQRREKRSWFCPGFHLTGYIQPALTCCCLLGLYGNWREDLPTLTDWKNHLNPSASLLGKKHNFSYYSPKKMPEFNTNSNFQSASTTVLTFGSLNFHDFNKVK